MNFTKMHGLGNDFVVLAGDVEVTSDMVRQLSHRRFGVGADGVLQVGAAGGLVTMGYWNADGTAAEMCGNGLRCVARWAWDRSLVSHRSFEVATPVGVRRVRVGDTEVSVDLGPTELRGEVEIAGIAYRCVGVGNPHAVAEMDPDTVDIAAVGSIVERHPHFEAGTNVEFYARTTDGALRMRVWERGVGETLACGTGIVAVAVASGSTDGPVTVRVPGGEATVNLTDGAWLTGPAETVFEGRWLSEPS